MIDLITQNNSKSPISEAYRIIRTNVQFSNFNKELKTIAITSATANEGKSTIVSNLGVIMAQAGEKVLIMDCNFRNPTQHKIFKMSNNGLSNCIATQQDVLDIIQHTNIVGLDVLTSGSVLENPSESLGSQIMDEILVVLGKKYDYILIDTTAILPVADTAVVAVKADGVIMVVACETLGYEIAQEAKSRLTNVGANIIGVILNKAEVTNIGNECHYGNEEKDED